MHVRCKLEFKDGESSDIKEWECFGFMYSFARTKELFGLETLDYVQGITFFPTAGALSRHLDNVLSNTEIDTYLKLLQEIGINKVIKTPEVMDHSNFTDGVYADMCTTSGQAFVGAFELIRNIRYNPVFVKLVTRLYNAGVSGEVALFIPRFLKESILNKDQNCSANQMYTPGADTSTSCASGMLVNNEKLFSKEVLANKNNFLPWIESGDFTGVFIYYSTGSSKIKLGSKTLPLLRDFCSILSNIIANDYKIPSFSTLIHEDYIFIAGCYDKRRQEERGFHLVLELCKHYELTGELP